VNKCAGSYQSGGQRPNKIMTCPSLTLAKESTML
jgi:hypothetical protein